jgi:glycosyltransferase involved in cell wall biosynthesis
MSAKVLIIQGQMKQYRVPLFEKLGRALRQDGIHLKVAYSDPRKGDGRKDNCDLSPEIGLKVKGRWLFSGRALYQPLLKEVAAADLVIAEQANKYLLNYLLLVFSISGIRRIAFWGLGENMGEGRTEISEWLRRQIVAKVGWWFAYTDSTADYLTANGVRRERITVVQNAIDTHEFRALVAGIDEANLAVVRGQLGIGDGDPVGLFCAALSPDKGLRFLLAAAQTIKLTVPRFHLVILGGGPEENVARAAAETYPWVHYVGPKFGVEKARFFRIADAMLLPGRVGLAILDAFAAGLPLITTDVPYHGPEVGYLSDGVNGFLAEHLVEAYASRCISLFADDGMRCKLKAGAMECGQKVSIDAMVSNFRSGIRACLQLSPRSSLLQFERSA